MLLVAVQALFLCALFLSKIEKKFTFSGTYSQALTNAMRRIFPRTEQTFASARSFGVISWASFSSLSFLSPQPLKKPSQSQKGHFYKKMNALNDTKTPELSKSAEGNGEYLWSSVAFVEAWIKSKSRNAKTGLKTTQMLHKNKACFTVIIK